MDRRQLHVLQLGCNRHPKMANVGLSIHGDFEGWTIDTAGAQAISELEDGLETDYDMSNRVRRRALANVKFELTDYDINGVLLREVLEWLIVTRVFDEVLAFQKTHLG